MTAIDEPQNARSRRTRAALLDAARTIVERDGFGALTMSAIAETAEVSRRATYLHFANRGDVLGALLEHLGEAESLGESLGRVWASPDARTALVEWAHHVARAHPRILAVAAAVEVARHTDPEAAEFREAVMERWRKGSRRLAEWLDDDGALADDWTVGTAADLIWGLMSWDLLERLTVDRGWTSDEFGAGLEAMLTATLLTPSPATSAR